MQGFGRLGRDEVPTFLLPSNPVSALVSFEVMVRPRSGLQALADEMAARLAAYL